MNLVKDWLEFLTTFGKALEDLLTIDVNSFGDIVDGFVQFGKDIWEGLKEGISSFGDSMETFIKDSMFKPIVDAFKKLFGIHSPSTLFEGFGKNLVEGLFNGIKSLMSKPVELVKKLWDDMSGAVVAKGSVIWDSSKKVWDDVSTKVKTKVGESWTNTKENWKKIKDDTSDKFENVRRTTVEKWDKTKDKVSAASSNAKTNATNAWSIMKTNVSGYNDRIKDNTNRAFNAVKGWAGKLGGELGSKLSKGKESVAKGAKKIGKGIYEFPMKAINGIIKGVSWVLKLVGAKDTAKEMKEYSFKYAQGTGYHPGGMALVNDGYGANYREAYQLPNGQQGLFPNQRNLMVDLPAGSSVLSGPRTASMMSDTPNYAGGVGKWIKKKWDGAKELVGDVWDYASNPSKLVEAGISRYADLKGAIEPSLSISQGAIATSMDAATDFVKGKMDEFMDSGDADTSAGGMMGVMQYLSSIASDVMKKFPGMVATSGYRHGDPYSHGKRQAIDIAYPSSWNGSSKYFDPADYAFNKFKDKVAYVITQGKVRDRSGMSGTGSSGQWRGWPDNDHYDHLHINGSIAQGQGGGGSSPKGSGVERWRSSVIRSLGMNKLPTSGAYVNAWMRQIQTESGGNPRAIGGNDGLADGNAMGLLQTKPPTFNAYKFKGFGDIFNGFHNMLAAMNYAKIRYGYTNMLGVIGHGHGYAKGTPYLPEDQLAMIHKGEMVVPASFNPMNPANNFQTLKMPDLFNETPQPIAYNQTADKTVGGGMNGATEGIINAVMMALSMRGSNSDKGGDINITLELEGEKVAKVVVDEVNKQTKRQGKSPILI